MWAGTDDRQAGTNRPLVVGQINIIPVEVGPKTSDIFTGCDYKIYVDATDPEDYPLTYIWEASGGSIQGHNNKTAKWTAPDDPGEYEIKVTIVDNLGELLF